jgi:hypothetical protein
MFVEKIEKGQVIVDRDAFDACIKENERLQKYAKAEAEGRLVVLPCVESSMKTYTMGFKTPGKGNSNQG